MIHPDYLAHSAFISTIPSLVAQGEGTVLHDGRNRVVLLEHQGQPMVVKRFKRVNWIQRIAYTLWRPTKAKRAYLYAAELRSRGIRTPHEIAYLEESSHGFFHTGWFICEQCTWPQAFPLLFEPQEFHKPLAAAVARHIAFLHQQGVEFGDLNLRNFLYHPDGEGSYEFSLVDTNRSHFHNGELPFELCMQNLHTLTHRRDLFQYILEQYAAARNLDPQRVTQAGMHYLDAFEQRIERKKKFKRIFQKS